MGPTKHRRRVRPAPQGRAYREQRHFCHVTVLVSSDGREAAPVGRGARGKTAAARGGQIDPNGGARKSPKKAADAAPPKKRAAQKPAEQPAAESAAPETTE